MEASEATIEIKIKTLDSQTYTLRVDKQMPVPALKEQIAVVTGVLSEQQRLICRGKVLKDDQLLSAYHVEDGHTLHMVVRQPISPSSEGLFNHPAHDPASTSRHTHQIAPGVVIETFSLPSQGDGSTPPEISQILSAVLGSMGISGFGSGTEGVENRDNSTQRPDRTSAAFSLGSLQPSVIPDSSTTMTQYLSNIRREFDAIGRGGTSSGQGEDRSSQSEAAGTRQGFPTPAALAEVIVSARHLLTDNAAEALLQVERQLENQANVTDSSARSSIQASAMRTGALIHNLGSFLLELGRTIMTLRMGQTPSEAVVNAGPAVFISPNGPNPIMVQALPFQVGSSIGSVPMGAVQSGSGLVNGLGAGYIPRRRRIDIQIRRGSPTPTATAMSNGNREEQGNTRNPSGQRNPVTSSENGEIPSNQGNPRGSDRLGESGIRVVPLRTMVGAVPGSFGQLSADSSGNSVGGLYYPVLGRFQQAASGNASGERGSQASGEQQSSESQQRPVGGDPARDGSSLRQNEATVNARSISINILSAGGLQNSPESDRQISGSVMRLLQNLFPGGEIHVEDGSSDAPSVPDQTRTSNGGRQEVESSASEDGIFLSNILRQIMPLIPGGQAGSGSEAEPANASENGTAQDSANRAEDSNAGTSRRPDDSESGSPSSKRRKTD